MTKQTYCEFVWQHKEEIGGSAGEIYEHLGLFVDAVKTKNWNLALETWVYSREFEREIGTLGRFVYRAAANGVGELRTLSNLFSELKFYVERTGIEGARSWYQENIPPVYLFIGDQPEERETMELINWIDQALFLETPEALQKAYQLSALFSVR